MDLAQYLINELERRKRVESNYSLRAFSRDLDINKTTLCFVINRQRNISRALAEKLMEKLNIPLAEGESLLKKRVGKSAEYKIVDLKTFEQISNWYHQGVLGLADLKKNEASPAWIATRLGISQTQAKSALERLVAAGLVKIVNKKMTRTHGNISTPTDVPSSLIRNYHKENFALATKSLDRDNIAVRDITAITFPIDKRDLVKMKDFIQKFQRQLCKKFEKNNGDEVYTLATQLFPLTSGDKSK